MNLSRRNFLKISSLAGGGLVVSWASALSAKRSPMNSGSREIDMNAFLTIDTNGKITAILTKHEMGQGTGTAVPTILADELGADWSKVVIKRSDYDPRYTWREMGTTGGSGSIERIWDSIRQAGATVREMLRQAAANKWGVDASILKVANSFVINTITNEKFEFGELAESASKLPIPQEVTLKKYDQYVYIGNPVKNRITKEVISGKASYGIDMDIPGMVCASIEKCPVFMGKLKHFDDKEARQVDGVIDIFPFVFSDAVKSTLHPKVGSVDEGVVVVANSTWTAFKARKLLKIAWDEGKNGSRGMSTLRHEMNVARYKTDFRFEISNSGKKPEDPGNEVLEVEYNNPHQSHALMEPLNATADFRGDTCEIWVGTQDGGLVNTEVAKAIGLSRENVLVHILNSGGSFGRRYHADTSIEAAFISKKINKPVKLTWTREDEIRHDHFHPYLRNYLKAIITPEKKVAGIEIKAISTSGYGVWSEKWRHYYYFPNIKAYSRHVPSMIQEGPWRSVGVHSSALAKECFIDELAYKISKDPLDYRIELLSKEVDWGDPTDFPGWVKNYFLPRKEVIRSRHQEVLGYIKEKGLWEKQMPEGSGKGLAIQNFGDTVCAEIAEVSMGDPDYGFKVDKVTAVVYCGLVVNPHFARGQIEGAIIWALTALKYGGVEVENGVVMRDNFHNNKVLRMDETPEVEVIFIESSEPPSGLGEPGTPPLAPAVLNAIFNASGKRIRDVPVTKDEIDRVHVL